MPFLPTSKQELKEAGHDRPDFVLISADAYVDHPSFGAAIIGRTLENEGFSVAMLPQPDWKTDDDFKRFGEPRLAFLIAGGNIDSMVNHYTVAGKKRAKDLYSPGGKSGLRPDRPSIVYSQRVRSIYKNTKIILGGIESSLRRLAHYDYWDDKVRSSILVDSGADLIVYGMGENTITEIAHNINSDISGLSGIRGIVYRTDNIDSLEDFVMLPAFSEVKSSKDKYASSFALQYSNSDAFTAKTLIEGYGSFFVVQTPPSYPLTTQQMDKVYSYHYMRMAHPCYEKDGGIPAFDEVKYSIVNNRGCFGACNFCALSFHQGRNIQTRSHDSIIKEAKLFTKEKDFKGYIHDVGGPTANFRSSSCEKQKKSGTCLNKKCLFPGKCKNLNVSHKDYLELLKKLRNLPGIKKVFIRSGIRYDYLMYDKDRSFFNDLCKHHISGQLKVAPEHISPNVLKYMGKPSKDVYDSFVSLFTKTNERLGLKQYIVPYLMSSHPGSTLNDAIQLAEYLRDIGHMPEQVQDFYPTPGTLSTCIYYTGIDPFTKEKVYVAKSYNEKAMQRALIQYRLPQNRKLVLEALKLAGREDLIGFGKKCLIKPTVNTFTKKAPVNKINQQNKPKKRKTIRNVHKKKG